MQASPLKRTAACKSIESPVFGSTARAAGDSAKGHLGGIWYQLKSKVSGCPTWFSGLQPSSLSFTRLHAKGRSPLLDVGDDT